MNNGMGVMLNGMKVFSSDLALEKTNEPMRCHQLKKWMRGRVYHWRIQKKWVKKYGYVMKPCIFRTRDAIFAHPSLYKEIINSIQAIPSGLQS